ncbi:MAG: hypothetical protein R3C20_03885 [Planctomycetaceae bacterium]
MASPRCAKRGIIRISGDQAITLALSGFTVRDNGGVAGRHGCWAGLCTTYRLEGFLQIDALGHAIPCSAMVTGRRRSFTGQPMAELHLPGATPLMDAVLEDKLRLGARMAGRGEFTMRAFLAGRIDLIQAEAVLGVIDAAPVTLNSSRRLTQLGGGITERLSSVRQNLIQLLEILKRIDFVEEDIEFITCSQILEHCDSHPHSMWFKLSKDSGNRLPPATRRGSCCVPGSQTQVRYAVQSSGWQPESHCISDRRNRRDYLLTSVILGKTPLI